MKKGLIIFVLIVWAMDATAKQVNDEKLVNDLKQVRDIGQKEICQDIHCPVYLLYH